MLPDVGYLICDWKRTTCKFEWLVVLGRWLGIIAFAPVRSNLPRRDLANFFISLNLFFVGGCNVALTYAIKFATIDKRCDRKIASNMFVNV